jgi:septum formation inhibitor MinC
MDKTLEEKDYLKLKKEYKVDFTKLSDETKNAKLDLEMAKKEYAKVKIGQKEIDIKRQVEQLTQAFIQDELLSDNVKKSIETKIGDVSHELNSIQKLVVDTKSQANEEKNKENRSRNIIIYIVEESDSSSYEIRNKHDNEIVIRLLRELIADDFEESEIQKVFRMGKMGESPKSRPILIQFVSKMTKN